MDIGEERKSVTFEPVEEPSIEEVPTEQPPIEIPQEEPIAV